MKLGVLGSRGYPSTYSGFETLIRHLAPGLVERGHDVTVYAHGGRWSTSAIEVDGVRVVSTPGINSKSISTPSHVFTAAAHAARQGFDGLIAVNLASAPALRLLTRHVDRIALNVDGLEWERDKWGYLASRVFELCGVIGARSSAALVADSRAIDAYYRKRFGRRCTFIPYGAPVREGVAKDRLDDVGIEAQNYYLIVARLVPENTIELMVEAYLRSGLARPLVVVGTANYESPSQEFVREASRLHESVIWLGHLADQELLEQLWAHSRLYLHGHSVGGTNPSLLQAMGVGARILAVDTVFNREVMGSDEDASFFPRDVEALAEMLRSSDADPNRLVGGMQAQSIIRSRYSWEGVVDAYEELLVGSRNAGGSDVPAWSGGSP